MNASSTAARWLLLALLVLFCLPWLAADASAFAADPGVSSLNLQANIVWDFMADRSRMIQISIVVVAFGCAIMWWYR